MSHLLHQITVSNDKRLTSDIWDTRTCVGSLSLLSLETPIKPRKEDWLMVKASFPQQRAYDRCVYVHKYAGAAAISVCLLFHFPRRSHSGRRQDAGCIIEAGGHRDPAHETFLFQAHIRNHFAL